MKQYKICVYAICKNEAEFVDRWMDAVSEADEVIVTDTGSTDGTVEKLRARGATVYEEKIIPWRFDAARNIALQHVPEDTDICVSNDLDEIFEQGWRAKLEAAWKTQYTRVRYTFVWSHDADGGAVKTFPMEKIHKKHGFQWIHPVHEVLEYQGKENVLVLNDLVLHHYPDLTKPRSQYLPLLELSVKEDPLNDRAVFWLGREYMFYEKHDECIRTLMQHLKLPSAKWDEERSASMRYIARSYGAKNKIDQEKAWLLQALAECTQVREPYLALTKFGYLHKDWPMVFAMAQKGLSITQNSGSYLVEPDSWGMAFYDYGAIAAYQLGIYDEALKYAKLAVYMEPDNDRLKKNLSYIQYKLGGLKEEGA